MTQSPIHKPVQRAPDFKARFGVEPEYKGPPKLTRLQARKQKRSRFTLGAILFSLLLGAAGSAAFFIGKDVKGFTALFNSSGRDAEPAQQQTAQAPPAQPINKTTMAESPVVLPEPIAEPAPAAEPAAAAPEPDTAPAEEPAPAPEQAVVPVEVASQAIAEPVPETAAEPAPAPVAVAVEAAPAPVVAVVPEAVTELPEVAMETETAEVANSTGEQVPQVLPLTVEPDIAATPAPAPVPVPEPAPVPVPEPEAPPQIAMAAPAVIAPAVTVPEVAVETPVVKPGHSIALVTGQIFRDCENCPDVVVVVPPKRATDSSTVQVTRSADMPDVAPYAIGRFEVTFDDWGRCMAGGGCSDTPGDEGWGRNTRPVINVSYDMAATQYLAWLSQTTGATYRLPTAAEWDLAESGAGTTAAQGITLIDAQSVCAAGNYANGGAAGAGEAACQDGFPTTAPVGSLKGTSLSLHDMRGNVWEWVSDCWSPGFKYKPKPSEQDCSKRLLRGGSWSSRALLSAKPARGFENAMRTSRTIGFRVARTLP